MGDMNGFTIELQGKEREVMYEATPGTLGSSDSPLDNVTGVTISA